MPAAEEPKKDKAYYRARAEALEEENARLREAARFQVESPVEEILDKVIDTADQVIAQIKTYRPMVEKFLKSVTNKEK